MKVIILGVALLFLSLWILVLIAPLGSLIGLSTIGASKTRLAIRDLFSRIFKRPTVLLVHGTEDYKIKKTLKKKLRKTLKRLSSNTYTTACFCIHPLDAAYIGVLRIESPQKQFCRVEEGMSPEEVGEKTLAYLDTLKPEQEATSLNPKASKVCNSENCPVGWHLKRLSSKLDLGEHAYGAKA